MNLQDWFSAALELHTIARERQYYNWPDLRLITYPSAEVRAGERMVTRGRWDILGKRGIKDSKRPSRVSWAAHDGSVAPSPAPGLGATPDYPDLCQLDSHWGWWGSWSLPRPRTQYLNAEFQLGRVHSRWEFNGIDWSLNRLMFKNHHGIIRKMNVLE